MDDVTKETTLDRAMVRADPVVVPDEDYGVETIVDGRRVLSEPETRIRLLSEIGTLKLTKAQRKILSRPTPDAIAAVKPTGEVYVPGVHYRRVLNEVFPGWGLRPLGDFKTNYSDRATDGRSTIFREYALVIDGVAVDVVIGEAEYHPSNKRLTYGDAVESLRTNALTRLCKNLGMFSEAWDQVWTSAWRRKYCVAVWIEKKKQGEGEGRPQWRRLDADAFYGEDNIVEDSPNRAAWIAQRAHRRAGGDPEPEQPAASRAAETPTPPASRWTSDGLDKELIATARPRKRSDGTTIYEIRTSVSVYFTDSRELFDAASAAAKSERPMAMMWEKRTLGGSERRWLTEMQA